MERLSLKSEDLCAIAAANLKRQLPEIGVIEEPPVMRVVTGGSTPETHILVADDGSSDGTADVAESTLNGFPGSRVLPWRLLLTPPRARP